MLYAGDLLSIKYQKYQLGHLLRRNAKLTSGCGWREYVGVRVPLGRSIADDRDQMATIVPFLRDEAVFDPEAVRIMSAAFDEACQALKLPDGAKRERETVAVRIIELARRGERNPERLARRLCAQRRVA